MKAKKIWVIIHGVIYDYAMWAFYYAVFISFLVNSHCHGQNAHFSRKATRRDIKGFSPKFLWPFILHACNQSKLCKIHTYMSVCIFSAVFVLNKSNEVILSKWVCVSPHSSFYQLANKLGKRLQLICCDNDTINPFYLSLSGCVVVGNW